MELRETEPAGILFACRGRFVRPTKMSTDDDLYTPVLRLAHAGTSWHQQIGIPKALNGDGVLRHTIGNQFGLDRFCTTNRETLIVLRCAGGIGVAVHLDPRVLHSR